MTKINDRPPDDIFPPDPAVEIKPEIDASLSLEKSDVINRLQERLDKALQALPALDSPEFWSLIESLSTNASVSIPLEALAWACRQLAECNELDKAHRVFTVLLLRAEKSILFLASNNLYAKSSFLTDEGKNIFREELAQKVRINIYRKIFEFKAHNFELNFRGTLQLALQSEAKDLARKEGLIQGSKANASDSGTSGSEVSVDRIPKNKSISTSILLNSQVQAEDKGLSLEGTLTDSEAEAELASLENTEIREALLARLTAEEAEILRLREEGLNHNQIAAILGQEWKWVDRRLKSIGNKYAEIMEMPPDQLARLQSEFKKRATPRQGGR